MVLKLVVFSDAQSNISLALLWDSELNFNIIKLPIDVTVIIKFIQLPLTIRLILKIYRLPVCNEQIKQKAIEIARHNECNKVVSRNSTKIFDF